MHDRSQWHPAVARGFRIHRDTGGWKVLEHTGQGFVLWICPSLPLPVPHRKDGGVPWPRTLKQGRVNLPPVPQQSKCVSNTGYFYKFILGSMYSFWELICVNYHSDFCSWDHTKRNRSFIEALDFWVWILLRRETNAAWKVLLWSILCYQDGRDKKMLCTEIVAYFCLRNYLNM